MEAGGLGEESDFPDRKIRRRSGAPPVAAPSAAPLSSRYAICVTFLTRQHISHASTEIHFHTYWDVNLLSKMLRRFFFKIWFGYRVVKPLGFWKFTHVGT